MIFPDALAEAGLSDKILKRILTSQPPAAPAGKKKVPVQKTKDGAPSPGTTSTLNTLEKLPENPTDWDVRCFLETMVRSESLEGQMRCAQNFDKCAAMDLAYSSIPIHPLVPDLMKVAMGYLKIEDVTANMAGLSDDAKNRLFQKDAKGAVTAINAPALIQVSHNLVHSLTTRRVASAATEFYQQYPLNKFDPYSNNQTERLKADVMTQLGEQMAGAYNYRHDYEESIRQASLYTTSFKFKAKAWHSEKQMVPVDIPKNGAQKTGRPAKQKFERKIVREGVLFTLPHPSRVSWDIAGALSKINSDLGPNWVDFFDVVRIGSLRDDPGYFNTEKIAMDAEMFSFLNNYAGYFAQYYGGCTVPQGLAQAERVTPIAGGGISAGALSLANDRTANIGSWAQLARDTSTVLTQHYRRVIPKNVGLGTYQDPVWIRFVMAANTTIIFAEILGSAPCSVNSYNASDGLLVSPSFAMQAVQFQQMLTNSLTELLHVQAQGLIRIWALNIHGMTKEEVEVVTNALKNPDFAQLKDIVIKYDKELLSQRGQDEATITAKIAQIKVETASKVSEIFGSIMNTLALAERLLFFSPQELGQVAPRTTTATEQKAIRDTTLGIRDYAQTGVKQMMDADKRIIHDSYLAFGSDDLETPIAERYPRDVIEKAGFEVVDDGTGAPPDGLFTIRGKKLGVFYNYTYTTRNTDDTPPDAAEAQALGLIYQVSREDEKIRSLLTNAQHLEMFNSFTQKVSPGFPRINLPPGVDPNGRDGGTVEQLQKAIPQIGQALGDLAKKQADQDAKIAANNAGLKALASAITKLSAAIQPPTSPPVRTDVSTQRGQIDPTIPPGNGAPPLRGVRRAGIVPAFG